MPEFTTYWSGLSDGALSDAGKVGITDTHGKYTSTNVDGALDEIANGATLLIARTTASGSATSVTLSSIPATFHSLMLIVNGVTSALQDLLLRFNGDTTANYDWQRLLVSNTTVQGSTSMGATSINLGAIGTTAGVCRVLIPNYLSATEKSVRSDSGSKAGTSAGNLSLRDVVGWWRGTDAITSITILSGSGGIIDGSVVSLYGIS